MIPRFNVLGVGIHAVNLRSATETLVDATGPAQPRQRYVCCCDAHSIMQARRSAAHRQTLNHALLATPDGMPMVWLGRRSGYSHINRVYGPDLLESLAAATADGSRSHYFYGGSPGVAADLGRRLQKRHPLVSILGHQTPPLSPAESLPLPSFPESTPDFVWVGLSTPKQEAFMHRLATTGIDFGVAIGVGAAFDFLTGRVRQASPAIQRSGLEWMWRLAHEPRRLGARYLWTVPRFAMLATAQLLRFRRYPDPD